METRSNLIVVGVFVLVVIAAAFGTVSWLLGGTKGANRTALTITFPGAVTGLVIGAPVNFNGIRAGEVVGINYPADDPTKVEVVVSIDRRAPVKVDSRVSLGFQGLTGLATVQITGGSVGAQSVFAEGRPREMQADASAVQDLVEGAQRVLGRADSAISQIDNLLKSNSGALQRIVENVDTTTANIAKNSANVDKFMQDLGKASDVLAKVSGKIDGLVDDVDTLVKSVEPAKVRTTLDNVTKITSDVAKSSGEFEAIVQQAKSAMNDLSKTASNANAALEDARKVIAGVDPAKVKSTVDGASDFAQYINSRTKDIDDVIAKVRSISNSTDTFMANLNAKNPEISKVLDDAAKISGRLETASQRVDGILAKVDGVLGTDEANGLFAQGRSFFTEAAEAAKSFRQMSDTINAKVTTIADGINRFTTTGQRDLRDLITDGRRTLNSIERTVDNLDRNPSRVIFGGSSSGGVPEYGAGRR